MKMGDFLSTTKSFPAANSRSFRVQIPEGSKLEIIEVLSIGVKVKQSGGRELVLTHGEVRDNCRTM